MRTRPTISFTISNKANEQLEKVKANKSKLLDYLLQEFFKSGKEIPKRFLKK